MSISTSSTNFDTATTGSSILLLVSQCVNSLEARNAAAEPPSVAANIANRLEKDVIQFGICRSLSYTRTETHKQRPLIRFGKLVLEQCLCARTSDTDILWNGK